MKLLTFLCGLALVSTCQASVVFVQSPPNVNSFDITDYRLADSFALTTGTILNGISFWYQAQEQTDLSGVSYAIYANSGGAPGALLASDYVNSPATNFDSVSGLFTADFAIAPIALSSDAYWLELHAGTSLTDASGLTVGWAAVDGGLGAGAVENLALGVPDTPVAFSGYDHYAFELSGTATPEPSSEGLAVCGAMAILAVWKRVRDKRS